VATGTVKLAQSDLIAALQARARHVFISGASRGIGEATARLLGEEGNYRFTLAARSYNRCLGVAMDLGTARAHAVRLDLQDERTIDEAVVAAESRHGPIEVLILNAAVNLPTPFDDLSAAGRAAFREVIETNVIGTYTLAQLAAAHMPNNGRILFVGSVLARFGAPGQAAYSASKHALMGLVRTLALELAPRGIRVNAVNPGWVDTEMAHAALSRIAQRTGGTLQQATANALNTLPIRRMVKPPEVAAYLKYLIGPGGDCITGQGIDISCGSAMI